MKPQTRPSKTRRGKRGSLEAVSTSTDPAQRSSQNNDHGLIRAVPHKPQESMKGSTFSGHVGTRSPGDVHPSQIHCRGMCPGPVDYFSKLSLEIICQVLSYLPLRDVIRLESLSRKMHEAVTMHLRLLRDIDFMEGEIYGWMYSGFTDTTFAMFLKRCPEIVNIYGLHLRHIAKRRQRVTEQLSIPGIIAALPLCPSLYGVETSDIFLLEAITNYLPHIHILRTFRNRNGSFPLFQNNRFELHRNPRITNLYLTGVVIPELPRLDFLQHLYLKWVKLTEPHPFREFGVPLLRTFVMNNCAGPTNALKYVPLITGLAAARSLSRLELVRVPFLGGLVQHVVEDSWRMYGFRQLTKVTFGTCKHALEVDLGYLVITCAHRLEELAVQPSLTKDSLFASLTLADVDFPRFETLHLGYVDEFPENGKWTNDQLVKDGLADITESPAMITDIGMRAVGQVFSRVKSMTVYNCPHLHLPMSWFAPVGQSWIRLKELHLNRCHALRLNDFCRMIPLLSCLESLFLEQMFREPPKGCSRVGLSAGTGLGVSSALVQNTGSDAVNQDAANNPHAVPANPNPANPAAAPPSPPPPDPEQDNDGEDLDYSDSDYEPPPGEPPFDQLLDPAAGGRHPMVDHVTHPDLNDPMHVEAVPLEEPHRNEHLNVSRQKKSKGGKGSNNDPEPGTSQDTGLSSTECKCQCSKSRDGLQSTSMPMQAASSANDASDSEDQPTGRGKRKLKTVPARQGPDIKDGSPSHRSKQMRLSRGTSPSCSSKSLDAGTSGNSSKYKGKGKSLCGRKKGLVKKSPARTNLAAADREEKEEEVQNRNQSCQAVSEEIRETTKKAKEKEEAVRRGGHGVGEGGMQMSGSVSTCPVHSASVGPCPVSGGPSTRSSWRVQAPPSTEDSPAAQPVVDVDLDSAVPSPSVLAIEGGQSHRTLGTQTGNRSVQKPKDSGPKHSVSKPHMCDQATSTSDPVIEEDHVQMLEIHSSSLMSVTLRQVGVTDLIITDCPKLQMLAGTACRVLKNVAIKGASQLTRVHFAQCKKLQHEMVIDQVCRQTPERNRLIFLRPMQMYDPLAVEHQVMSCPDYNYNMCLIQDYCPNPELTLYNRIRATSWLDIMFNINFELLNKSRGFQKANRKSLSTGYFPWGRHIYRMQGESEDRYMWDLITDLPWLRPLAACSPTQPDNCLSKQDKKLGLYNPWTRSHGQTEVCLKSLEADVAEAKEQGLQLYTHCALIYINMCDLYGPPVSDRYL